MDAPSQSPSPSRSNSRSGSRPTLRPEGIAAWRADAARGIEPRARLHALRQRLEDEGAGPVWITLASAAQIDAQLEALEARAAMHAGDTAALLREMPLYGVPFAAKDNIDIAGLPTTAACPAWTRVAQGSAAVVEKLVGAGAVWLGKTNLDQFATGLVGTRSPYGRPASAYAADRISGGSSSGSAVAVARGDVAFALGTDTAGSGRVPAGFNALVGLKPTPGRVSTRGVLPACRTLDCVSVLAHDVAEAGAVLAVIEGADAEDAYSVFEPGPAALPAKLRIGVPRAPFFFGDAGYASAFEAALATLRGQGHEPVAIDFDPLHAVADLLYSGPWVAERHAVVKGLLAADPGAFDPSVRRVIETATNFSATDTFRAQYRLREAQQASAALWAQVDVLMVPTAPGHPRFDEVDADPIGVNAKLGTYTNFVNLLGWCALAVPAGIAAEGLPFGVTFIGPAQADAALAAFGQTWQGAMTEPAASVPAEPLTLTPALPTPATEPTLALAVVGAHLSGLPLHGQLVERRARFVERTTTAARYRLHALPGSVPPKPGLVRVGHGEPGHPIEVEVWQLPQACIGSFLALIPPPLGLGSIELADGRWVHGFLCEAHALAAAPDISQHGGWRGYLASIAPAPGQGTVRA